MQQEKMNRESATRGKKICVKSKSDVNNYPNSRLTSLPEHHQLLAKCRFREFQSSLKSFVDFGETDFEQRSILTFGIYLFENLIESILCSGAALGKLHELENDIYTYLNEKRATNMNLSFKVISTEKKGFTLLPLEYKGYKDGKGGGFSRNKDGKNNGSSEEESQLIPPKEYLEIIGYKEPITRSYVFQFPYNSTPEELIAEKCIIDLLRRKIQDEEWMSLIERVCSRVSDLSKIILYLITNYPMAYKRFRKESGGFIFSRLKNPLFYMATMKLMFDEYPNVHETGEELNPKDPGDARRLVNRIRRNKLVGVRLLDVHTKLLNSMSNVFRILGGSPAWRCGSEYAQYYLHMSFVFDNPAMFSQLSSKNFMFDHDIFEWNYTLNSLSQHIPLLNSFLKPLAVSILASRVRNRLLTINEYKADLQKQQTEEENESAIVPPLFGSSIEARFLTNEVIKRSNAFFGTYSGGRLINSIKSEYDDWQYKPIIQSSRDTKGIGKSSDSNKDSIDEYCKAVLVPERKYRHAKSVINNALPPLSHISSKNKNLEVKIAPGQKYVQSFYNNKISIPENTAIQ